MKAIFMMVLVVYITIPVLAQNINPSDVKKEMKRVADWQIEHFSDVYSYTKKPHHPLDWTSGALYAGMVKWAKMAKSFSS